MIPLEPFGKRFEIDNYQSFMQYVMTSSTTELDYECDR